MNLHARLTKVKAQGKRIAEARLRDWLAALTDEDLTIMYDFVCCLEDEGEAAALTRFNPEGSPWYTKLMEGNALMLGVDRA